jgi:hypothetical protein
MYRTFVILRHTFREALVQPIYWLLIVLGLAILGVFAYLPFFTLSDDTVMFKDVGLDVVLLLTLISTLFATSRSIFDEIEDRTMLTLMSKPLSRWQVLLGKYLGIIVAALLAVAILGGMLELCTYLRIPRDYLINPDSLDDRDVRRLAGLRWMHLAGLLPSLVLVWLQIGVLASVGVALSTRLSLVVNLPLVILLYMAGNLTRFLPQDPDQPLVTKVLTNVAATVLPYLELFDMKGRAIYGHLAIGQFSLEPGAMSLSQIWLYVLAAAGYAAAYVFFALVAGMCLFRGRELGGAEG